MVLGTLCEVMGKDVSTEAEELLERVKDAEPGDALVFDESGGEAPQRRVQATEFAKLLDCRRRSSLKNEYECRDCGETYVDTSGDHCPECGGADVMLI